MSTCQSFEVFSSYLGSWILPWKETRLYVRASRNIQRRICVIRDVEWNRSLQTLTRLSRLASLYKSCGWVRSMAAWLWRVWWTSMDPDVKRMEHLATLVPTISTTFHRRIFSLVTRPKIFTRTYQHHPSWVHHAILHNSKCTQIPWRSWKDIVS